MSTEMRQIETVTVRVGSHEMRLLTPEALESLTFEASVFIRGRFTRQTIRSALREAYPHIPVQYIEQAIRLAIGDREAERNG